MDSPVTLPEKDSFLGKLQESCPYIYDDLSPAQIEFIENLEKNSVLKSIYPTEPPVGSGDNLSAESQTIILDSDDSVTDRGPPAESVLPTSGVLSGPSLPDDSLEQEVILPGFGQGSLSPSTDDLTVPLHTTVELDDRPTLEVGDQNTSHPAETEELVPPINRLESFPPITPTCPPRGPEPEDPLFASYRDILLAHLPVYSNKTSNKPGVLPIGPLCRNVIYRRNPESGGDTTSPGHGGDTVAIPLSVRLNNAISATNGALRASPPQGGV